MSKKSDNTSSYHYYEDDDEFLEINDNGKYSMQSNTHQKVRYKGRRKNMKPIYSFVMDERL